MAQVVLAFIVVAAAVFYTLVKGPQTDSRMPASTAPAVTAATVLPPPQMTASKPATTSSMTAEASVHAPKP